MSSVKIPKWIGPVLCPIVLLLLIAVVCFYYCYWKPRREKNKGKKQAEDEETKKKMISPSTGRQSTSPKILKGKSIQKVGDEEMSYGLGYYDCDTYTTYGPYCMDYCSLPNSGLSYCVQYDSKPKFVYYPTTSYYVAEKSRDGTSHVQSSRSKLDRPRKCRVRCPKGESIRCPHLPVITEGNSTLSLCDEKEEDQLVPDGKGLMCVCNDSENEQSENLEVKTTSTVSGEEEDASNCCRDSGFEDH